MFLFYINIYIILIFKDFTCKIWQLCVKNYTFFENVKNYTFQIHIENYFNFLNKVVEKLLIKKN